MGKTKYRTYHGVRVRDMGVRYWYKYNKPYEFNIIVNDMRDIMAHEDAWFPQTCNYGIQSSAAGWGYRVHV